MYSDITAVTLYASNSCNNLYDDNTLIIYKTNAPVSKVTYKLFSNKYIATISESPGDSIPAGTICSSNTIVQTLPSNFDYMTPIYFEMAIISTLFIFYAGYRLFIYPFWRKRIT